MDSITWRKGSGVDVTLEPLELRWRNLFSQYDLDNDGKIEATEFIQKLKDSSNHDIPPGVIQHLTRSIRESGHSEITYKDFVKLMSDRTPKNPFQRVFLLYIRNIIPPRNRLIDRTDGDYEDEYTCDPPAVFMLLISLIEVSIFICDAFQKLPIAQTGPVAGLLLYNPHRRAEAWRFITYMFVHVGHFHLVVNVVIQLLLGIPLEMVHRWWRVLFIYLAGVLAGSLGTSVSDPNVYLAGASGGVYALITAHLATIILNWAEMKFALGQLVIFLLLILTDTGSAIYNRYTNVDNKIGYAAHFAGALAGLLVGLYVLRNLEVQSWEKKVSRLAVLFYLILLIGIIVFNVSFPSYFPYQDKDIFVFEKSDKDLPHPN